METETDWKALLPELLNDRLEGLTTRQSGAKRGLPHGSIGRWLKRYDNSLLLNQSPPESERIVVSQVTGLSYRKTARTEVSASLPAPSLTPLEQDRELARLAMRASLRGKQELSASKLGVIKLLLKDELEPETERNLYVGRETQELAERSLVLAVSVLGLAAVVELLKKLSRAGTLDLGLDFAPDPNDDAVKAEPFPSVSKPEEEEEVEDAKPLIETPALKGTAAYGVETL